MNGKKWNIVVVEKFGSVETKVFESKKVFKELSRPARATDLFEDWLFEQDTFDYENHALRVVRRWFSLTGVSRGFQSISKVLNQPLVFKDEDGKDG